MHRSPVDRPCRRARSGRLSRTATLFGLVSGSFFAASLGGAVGLSHVLEREAFAAKLGDVTFEDTLSFEGKELVLNGLGLRKFALFKVYVGALYLEKKSTAAEEIITSPGTKVLKLRFLRDVGVKDIRKAWKDGLEKNCGGDACKSFLAEIDALNALMDDFKEGQTLQFVFTPEAVAVSHDSAKKGEVRKPGFSNQVLAIFIGKNPPNEALREGLLGK